jgi:hypothetical protein
MVTTCVVLFVRLTTIRLFLITDAAGIVIVHVPVGATKMT